MWNCKAKQFIIALQGECLAWFWSLCSNGLFFFFRQVDIPFTEWAGGFLPLGQAHKLQWGWLLLRSSRIPTSHCRGPPRTPGGIMAGQGHSGGLYRLLRVQCQHQSFLCFEVSTLPSLHLSVYGSWLIWCTWDLSLPGTLCWVWEPGKQEELSQYGARASLLTFLTDWW